MHEDIRGLSAPDTSKSITREIVDPGLAEKGIRLYLKREDRIHDFISGNKWRKIKYNLGEAKKRGYNKILTFGGAYSNHIYAVAAAGMLFGFETVGVIRGERYDHLNPTLSAAVSAGMILHYINRADFSNKYSEKILGPVRKRFGDFYLIPEGGSNVIALKGCIEMVNEIEDDFDMVCLPCGTGGTLAGILEGLKGRSFVLGFPVLKEGAFLRKNIDSLNYQYSGNTYDNYRLNTHYHFGGYAKFNGDLIGFINSFKINHQCPLDPVYTGKMMYGIYDMIRNGRLRNMKILAIHTGGLQGIAGFNERFGNIIY
jgi:1-aminocyclopropane-1-carboxylate deaminase